MTTENVNTIAKTTMVLRAPFNPVWYPAAPIANIVTKRSAPQIAPGMRLRSAAVSLFLCKSITSFSDLIKRPVKAGGGSFSARADVFDLEPSRIHGEGYEYPFAGVLTAIRHANRSS